MRATRTTSLAKPREIIKPARLKLSGPALYLRHATSIFARYAGAPLELAHRTGQAPEQIVEQLVSERLSYDEWFRASVAEGFASLD